MRGKVQSAAATLGYKGVPDAAVSTVPVVGASNYAGENLAEGFSSNDQKKEAAAVGDSFMFGGILGGLAGLFGGGAGIGALVGTFSAPALLSAGKAIGYVGMRALGGALSAGDDIWDFTVGGINKLLGRDEAVQEAFDTDFGDKYRQHIDEKFQGTAYQDDGFIKKVGDYAEVIGNAIPMAAAASVGTIFGGGAPLALSALVAGLRTAGKSTKRASEETGELGLNEFKYGALAGATEAATNLATGYVLRDKLSSALVPSQSKKRQAFNDEIGADGNNLIKAATNMGVLPEPGFMSGSMPFAKLASRIAAEALIPAIINTTSEALEGGVTAWLDPYFRRWTIDENAQNASIEDITKAALTDAGAAYLLGWIGFSESDVSFYNNDPKAYREQLTQEGDEAKDKADEIIAEAEKAAEMTGDYKATKAIADEVEKLKHSLEATGGKVETDEQKMLLGEVQKHAAARKIVPLIEDSAVSILQYPEAYVEKIKHLDIKDDNGKPLDITVEEITDGIDYEGTEEEFFSSVQKALTKNKTLAMIASADMADKVVKPDAEKIAWMQYGSGASDAQVAEMESALGGATTYSSAKQAAKQYASTPEGQAKVAAAKNIEKKAKSVPPNNIPVPTVIGTAIADGVYRYGGANGIAIIKENGVYHIYDYARGLISKPLTAMQVNAALARGRNQK